LQIEARARSVERWAAPKLLGVVDARAPDVWVGVRNTGAVVGVAGRTRGAEDERSVSAPVVAFDIDAFPERGDLVFVISRARGSDLPAPATAVAIACADALFRGIAKREGALLYVRGGANTLARMLFPEAGARAPDCGGVGWTSIGGHGDTWILHAARDALAASPSEEALRAREVAMMLREADEALVAGDLEGARALALESLERAPRHGEIVRRIFEVDSRMPERAEMALSFLAEARSEANWGTSPGELLALTGDLDAAVASFERVGDTEPTPSLAARAYERAAHFIRDPEEAARWLDRAIEREARSTTARWLRVAKRLELGRIEDALSDVEHLEALAHGGAAKHSVWWRAGRAWQKAGLGGRAVPLFERALRHAPDDPRVLAGLGQALLEEGHTERGVALLIHAIGLAEMRAQPTSAMLLTLARALAERLDDLPTAIARVSSIPQEASEAPIARGLEGRWRARLGDVAGAALSFARLREMAASLATTVGDASPVPSERRQGLPATIELLVEGANLQRFQLQDLRGAQRYLAAALRLGPHDPELRRAYRELGALLVDAASTAGGHVADEAQAAARVDDLTRRLHADPRDDLAAEELASLLQSLHRGHELLALLSARLEDATPERRNVLAPRARAALERVASEADMQGRLEEAALYRSAIRNLPR
jgi:tetratricopeptide (TPR) repeat protein